MYIKALSDCAKIGGNVIEIGNTDTRIVIDFGMDLDNDEIKSVPGLTYDASKYDAVLISHYHGDHIGLIHTINKDIPIYIDEMALQIYQTTQAFLGKNYTLNTQYFKHQQSFQIKSIKITPYIIDHSAYNAYMFYIEDGEDSILFTGDFRLSGYKHKLIKLVEMNCRNVNKIIIEGTNYKFDKEYLTEQQLQAKAEGYMRTYQNVLILQSSTNIDRIVSFYKAAKKTGKVFIQDIFTANITKLLDKRIPNINFKDVYAFLPIHYHHRSISFSQRYIKPFRHKMKGYIFTKPFVFMIKVSMIDDLKQLHQKGLLDNTCLLYSMWNGYKDTMKDFFDELERLNIPVYDLHTSGHASKQQIDHFIQKINPNQIYPIHTESFDLFKEKYGTKIVNIMDKGQS